MDAKWWSKVIFVLFLTVLSILYIVPSLADKNADGDPILPSWYPFTKTLRPGLDLKGGIHMVLGVEWEKALIDDAVHKAENIKDWCKDQDIPVERVYTEPDGYDIFVQFKSADDLSKYGPKILDYWKIFVRSQNPPPDDRTLRLSYDEREIASLKEGAIKQAIDTIRRRIDPTGTGEMVVARQGDSSIVVEMPGFTNIDRAKNLIGQTAVLAFQMVDESDKSRNLFGSLQGKLPKGIKRKVDSTGQDYLEGSDIKAMQDLLKQVNIPPEIEVLFEKSPDPKVPGKYIWRSWSLKKRVELTGDKIQDARVLTDRNNKPYVSVEFNPEGARIFAKVTGDNVGKKMAIVLDKEVRSAPVIKEKIPHGRAQITLGSFKSQKEMFEDARDLAVVLRAGALPAPVKFEEIRTVGATLGADSIEKGKQAIIISFVAVIIFMVIYYKLSGVFATIALLLNMLFIIAALVGFQATVTLPGLAGIVLTIGMAVDANVIINERIREELRMGKTPRSAVETGYARAFWTIFDANITTAIAAFVLWSYGSGPVQGFAITLLIGIAASMFTAIVVTRLLMDYVLTKFKPKTLSI